MTDPFAHHPELRDRITDPAGSFFRTLDLTALAEMMDQLGLEKDWWYSDAERESGRRAFLSSLPDGDLWVFAYGSLMSDPGFHFAEVRRAHLPGHARRFILYDTHGGRGTPDRPGLMAALDQAANGTGCAGLAFRIEAARIEAETERLWQREMIAPCYLPVMVPALTDGSPQTVLAFLADHSADPIHPELTFDQQVRLIASGTGFLGSSRDYLEKIDRQLCALGIDDPDVTDLVSAVRMASSGTL